MYIFGAKPSEGADEVDILREYDTGKCYRQFTLSQIIDQGKINAEMKGGVLTVKLPKSAAAREGIKKYLSAPAEIMSAI